MNRLALGLGLLAVAVGLRLAWLADWPLWLDESWSRWMTEQSWAGLRGSAALLDTHPPFYYSLLKLWTTLAPATPLSLRLPSIAAGLAMLPIAWACARRLQASPWLVAAFVAVSPPLVVAARQARPYALFALAFAVALWAVLRLIRPEARDSRGLRVWLVYLLALEALLWLHSLGAIFAAALAGAFLLALLLERARPRDFILFAAVHGLAALAWLPAFLAIVEQRRAWTQTWLRFAFADVPQGIASGLAMPGIGAVPILLVAGLGARAMLRDPARRSAAIVLLVSALGPALATIGLSVVSSPVFLPRTLLPSVLPVLILAGAGAAAIAGSRPARLTAALAPLVLLAAASALNVARPPEERWTELAAWLDRRVGAGEEVWLFPNELSLPLRYARGPSAAPYPVHSLPAAFPAPNHVGPRYSGTAAVPGMTARDARRALAAARARGARGVWVVSRFAHILDPGRDLPRALAGERRLARTLDFAPLVVDHYRLSGNPIPPPG
jgi:mannosyltransferase